MTSEITILRKRLTKSYRKIEEKSLERARLGKKVPGGWIVDVPGQPGKVFIQIYRNGGISLTTARNWGAPLTVSENPEENDYWVSRDPKSGDYVIERRIEVVDADNPIKPNTVAPHTHRLGSGMEDIVEGLRFLPGLVHRKSGLTVRVREFTYKTATGYAKFPNSNFDLTPYLPTTAFFHAWVVVGFDPDTETLTAVKGTEVVSTTELTSADIANIAISFVPLCAVKLINGQTAAPHWTDFLDLRNWFVSFDTAAAPVDAQYITATTSSGLSAEQSIGELDSGLLYNDVTGSVGTLSKATSSQVVGAIDDAAITSEKIETTLSGKAVDDHLDFGENTAAAPSANQIRVFANDDVGKTELFTLDSTGLERALHRDITITARNVTGSTIAAGKVVRVNGTNSTSPTIAQAQSDTTGNVSGVLGVTLESINSASDGRVMLQGIAALDTSSLSTGAVYVSDTVAGNLTTTAPSSVSRQVGFNIKSNANGILLIAPQAVVGGSGSGGAPVGAGYITKTAEGDLTNEFALGSLATGLLRNTTGTGIPTIATSAEIVASIDDGAIPTAKLTDTPAPKDAAYIVKTANGTLTGEFALSTLSTGLLKVTTTTGDLSTAASSDVVNTIGINAIGSSKISDLAASKITGQLGVANGGTGRSTVGNGRLLVGNVGTGVMTEVAGTVANNTVRFDGNSWAAMQPDFGEVLALATITGSDASISLTSLSGAGDFDHLVMILTLRGASSSTRDALIVRFNNDSTAANYSSSLFRVNSAGTLTASEELAGAASGIRFGNAIVGSTAPADHFSAVIIKFLRYKSSAYKMIQMEAWSRFNTNTGNMQYVIGGGIWLSTSAITRIDILSDQPSMKVNSSYAVYGIG